MIKFLFSFFLFFLPFSAKSTEPIHNIHNVSAKCIKRCNGLHKLSTENSPASKTITPLKIHRRFWPCFCKQHLSQDPEGCSSWSEDENGKMQLDFILQGYAEAFYDKESLQRIGNLLDLIPTSAQKLCDYAFCSQCKQVVLRGISFEEDEEEEDALIHYLVYRCGCSGDLWLYLDDLDEKGCDIVDKWQFCKQLTIFPGYLESSNEIYFHCFEKHLKYLSENPTCDCFWPQLQNRAKGISNYLYSSLNNAMCEEPFEFIKEYFHPSLINRSRHGVLSSLLSHLFFYSDYHLLLSDLSQCCFKHELDYEENHPMLLKMLDEIQNAFLPMYQQCLQRHPHPKVYYERGMLLFHRGEVLDSLDDIRTFISYAEKNSFQDLLTSDLYLNEGRLLNESLSYDEAIVSLTKAISKDSKNKEAYFERAIAYFETGDFNQALSDYLSSGMQSKKVHPKSIYQFKYGQGIALGMIRGAKDSTLEFVPSLLSSLRGLSHGLWGFVSDPIAMSEDMIDCVDACLEFILETTAKELFSQLVPELQEYFKKWYSLDSFTQGEAIGYVLGKYGVDIFIGSGSVKAIQIYRNLRKANAMMTFETAAISPKHAKEILAQCAKEYNFREELFKSGRLKIEWDKQGKHIPSQHNYQPGKSVFDYPDAQKLLENFAGKGKKANNVMPGEPGYKEIIDFKEQIGIWKSEDGSQALRTTRGAIHYSKKGAHIVPLKPKE